MSGNSKYRNGDVYVNGTKIIPTSYIIWTGCKYRSAKTAMWNGDNTATVV
jgi:hypothetical protein